MAATGDGSPVDWPRAGAVVVLCAALLLGGCTATPTSVPAPVATPKATRTLAPTPVPTPTPTLGATPTPGGTFYLSPTGSDTANGSLGAPRRSLRAASRLLKPGDTLLVRGGTYDDPGGYDWAPTASGTAASPITVKAYPGETPVFDGNLTVQQALIVQNVAYVTFDGLSFTRYAPYDNGIILIVASDHITLRGIHSYGSLGVGPGDSSSDHHIYISNGASNILIDGCYLDGIQGGAVHIYGGAPSSNVTVTNSRITNNGFGIMSSTRLAGGTFANNVLTGNGNAFWLNASGASNLTIHGNAISGPVGFWVERLTSVPGLVETSDCIDSPAPFKVGWPEPSSSWTLAQWQARGLGVGTTLGACGQ